MDKVATTMATHREAAVMDTRSRVAPKPPQVNDQIC